MRRFYMVLIVVAGFMVGWSISAAFITGYWLPF